MNGYILQYVEHTLLNIRGKIKEWEERVTRKDVFTALLVVFVGLASFGLGKLSAEGGGREPVSVEYREAYVGSSGSALEADERDIPAAGEVVGSVNSDKYHLPWCSGAQRIKEENLVRFASIAEAEAKGYVPAGNCPGLH
jgi:hypothetical protein